MPARRLHPQGWASTRTPPYVVGDRALRLRTMETISSPLDALAIVRAVERRFGRVSGYHFYRDAELSNRYQFVAYLSLWDPAAYSRVPKNENGTTIYVKLPPESSSPVSGGPGLADITPFLGHQDWTDNDLAAEVDAHFGPPEKPADGSRIFQFQIQHYQGRFDSGIILPGVNNRHHASVMANFVRWGGFAPKKPLPEPPIITQSDVLFGGGSVDHPCMRHQLMAWHIKTSPYDAKRPLVESLPPIPNLPPNENQSPQSPVPEDAEASAISTNPDLPWMTNIAPTHPSPEPTASDSTSRKRFPSLAASQRQSPSSLPSTADKTQPSRILVEANDADAILAPPPSPAPVHEEPVAKVDPATLAPSSSAPSLSHPKSAKADSSKPAPKPKQAAPLASPAAMERRNNARAARVVMQKAKPTEPVSSVKVKAAASQPQPPQQASKQQPVASTDKKKRGKANASPQTDKATQPPIEVEERTSGMAERLKGMMRGWI
ncbi:hypothetical protein MSAN_01677100 [Mycena sanguinolenta]|uniref:Uncharacterized protein n=1 Tax=Mycena sanguinolenta TaxID=230812 RepID=A0A8H7CX24_9AGAR|nr:hypothetical protein MSAN_01677100 [Mycena sanguinolenta]